MISGKIADMLLKIDEYLEDSFEEIIEKIEKNTKLMEKILSELSMIKEKLDL